MASIPGVTTLTEDQRDALSGVLDVVARTLYHMSCDLVVEEFKIKDTGLVPVDHPILDSLFDIKGSLKDLRDQLDDWQGALVEATRLAREARTSPR
jgi:hypothetical protein